MHIVIIGGGIGGLSCAFRLLEQAKKNQRKIRLTLCNREAHWGGVTTSSERDGFILEHGPDSIIRIKPAGMRLVDDLGLSDQIQNTSENARSACILRGNKLIPTPPGLYLLAPGKIIPFALSPLISWPGKMRMGLDLILPRRRRDAPEESLAAFVRRRLGREALERLAQPMIGGIYTADPDKLSLAATMPQFCEMEREHRSLILGMMARQKAAREAAAGPRYGLFTSLRGGLGMLATRLTQRLAGDVDLLSSCPVKALTRDSSGFTVYLDGKTMKADAVVCACPLIDSAPLVAGVDDRLAADMAGVHYSDVATISIALRQEQLRRPLPAAAGFVIPDVEKRRLIACTFSSQKYEGRHPPGTVLLRGFVGGAMHGEQLKNSDAALITQVYADLGDILHLRGEPLFTEVHRYPRSMAQPHIGHRERVLRIRAAEDQGLALVSNGLEGVGIPDLAAQAEAVAKRLFS